MKRCIYSLGISAYRIAKERIGEKRVEKDISKFKIVQRTEWKIEIRETRYILVAIFSRIVIKTLLSINAM